MHWIPFVMVRITAVFIAGILISIYYPQFLGIDTATILFLICALGYFPVYYFLKHTPSIKIFSGTLGLGAVLFAGILNGFLKNESHLPDHLSLNQDKILACKIKLTGSAEEKSNSWKRTGSVEAILTESGWKSVSGKVNLYWPKSEDVQNLEYGDVILTKDGPLPVEAPLNPHAFDLKSFLGYKNIFHQQYVRPDEWKLLNKTDDKGFLYYANRSRTWAVNAIKRFVHAPHQQAIAVALVLGVTDGIDNDLRNAYAASGAMHVLAVSGLHVSIIYGILLFIFRPLNFFKVGPWIIAMVCLGILWAYAFITGLSPSVLRAVVMFSFMAVAKPFARTTNIYNTLAASAFCLLIYDPFLIMSVGFQLSYLAVWGIVYMYRPLYNLWEAKSPLMNWTWQITCVSIAAQIATMPLTLFYFHQFPVYALLSNLFVIPGSFVVLVGGILLLMVSPLTVLATWLGVALEWFVKIYNESIFLVEQLPMNMISDLYISPAQSLWLALFILSALLLIQFRRFHYVLMLFATALLFSAGSWNQFYSATMTSGWTVYSVKGHSAMEWRENGHALFLADSAFLNEPDGIRFHLQPERLVQGVSDIQIASETQFRDINGLRIYHWKSKTFLWIRSKSYRLPEGMKVDCLVISNNAVQSLKETVAHVNFDCLIFDGSNSYRYCDRLGREAQSLNLVHTFVLKDGPFTLNL